MYSLQLFLAFTRRHVYFFKTLQKVGNQRIKYNDIVKNHLLPEAQKEKMYQSRRNGGNI